MPSFIEVQLEKTCNVDLPENMKGAYSDPLGLLYFATIVVVARNLVPLAKIAIQSLSNKFRNAIIYPSGEANEEANEEVSDSYREGAECPDGESKGGLMKLAREKIEEEAKSRVEEARNRVDTEIGDIETGLMAKLDGLDEVATSNYEAEMGLGEEEEDGEGGGEEGGGEEVGEEEGGGEDVFMK